MARRDLDELHAWQANAAIARRCLAIRSLAAAVKGQVRLLKTGFDQNPTGHLRILEEMGWELERLHDEVIRLKNSVPTNASQRLRVNIRGTVRRIEREVRTVCRDLQEGCRTVDEVLKDPARATSEFDGGLFSIVLNLLQIAQLTVKKIKQNRTRHSGA
jgi:hypothetical protein